VLDFEGHSSAEREAMLAVVSAIADSAHRAGVSPGVVAVPATDTAAYPARAIVAAGADLVLVMLYDELWAGSPPGPIASPEWARRRLATRIAEVGASRIVAGLPVYGYHWRPDAPTHVVGYADALRIATAAGLTLEREPASQTLRVVRPDSSQVWVADAALLRTLVDDAEGAGVRRFALWRLGLEDPAIWEGTVR
jgi:spore germination protein YaaH